jgi:lauroyl/myristoyl acyltransferase
MYIVLRILAIVVPRLPRRLVMQMGALAGTVAWLLAFEPRKQATRNALRVLGSDVLRTHAGRRRLHRTVRGMFITNVRNYLENCALPAMSDEAVQESAVTDKEHLDKMLALGKGAVLISAHFGPFDYISQCVQISGYPLTIPVESLRNRRLLRLMLAMRCSHGVQYVPLNGISGASSPSSMSSIATMRILLQQLHRNHLVLITVDQTVQGRSIEVPLFGEIAHLPAGPVQLALRAGAPLAAAFGWYDAHCVVHGAIIPISLALPPEQRSDADTLIRMIAMRLEQAFTSHPEQWIAFTSIWDPS